MLYVNAFSLAGSDSFEAFFDAFMAQSRPDYTIQGFPEYATGPDTLAPDQRGILSKAAIDIDRSQSTFQPVVGAIVIGHADKALRKPIGERAQFEAEVSQHRADSALDRLREELLQRSQGAHYAKTLRMYGAGIGNLKPRFANAVNEQQMRMNRRVEIMLFKMMLGRPLCRTF